MKKKYKRRLQDIEGNLEILYANYRSLSNDYLGLQLKLVGLKNELAKLKEQQVVAGYHNVATSVSEFFGEPPENSDRDEGSLPGPCGC